MSDAFRNKSQKKPFMPVPRRNRLSYVEAQRALYIDFEGQKDKPPVLLGCARRPGRDGTPRVWQAVLDPLFVPLAEAEDLRLLTLPTAVEHIVIRAEVKDRLIVAWSEHELDIVRESCPTSLVARFEARFVNGRKVAVRWSSLQTKETRPVAHKLTDYLAHIGYVVPCGAVSGRVGATIAAITKTLARGRGFAGLTASQKLRWQQLREHNAHDCAGLREVSLRAARELEAALPRSR